MIKLIPRKDHFYRCLIEAIAGGVQCLFHYLSSPTPTIQVDTVKQRHPVLNERGIIGFSLAIFCAIVPVLFSVPAAADFTVAYSAAVETKPAVAYNSQTGEYLVAYLEEREDLQFGLHYELRVRRFRGGMQQGTVLQPFGSGTHQAIGRPAIAYSPNSNIFLVAIPERVPGTTAYDRVLARFLDGSGNSLIGPDFLFDNSNNTYYDGNREGAGSLRITHNSRLDEFVVTVQLTSGGNNGVWAQRITYIPGPVGSPVQLYNSGLNGFNSHAIAYAPVGVAPHPGYYLFAVGSSVKLLSHELAPITSVPLYFGEPEGDSDEIDISYGEVGGQKRFLLVYRDSDNCKPGTSTCSGNPLLEWSGIWGTYVDPARTSYSLSPDNTPFPISKIYSHIAADAHMPRVTYNEVEKAFFIVWRELPGKDSDGERLSHIRGGWVDYLVDDGLYGTNLVTLPHKDIVISEVTGSCQTTWPFLCLSDQDPFYPDVSSAGNNSISVVWQQKYPLFPTDLDILGDLVEGGVHPNRSIGTFRNGKWYLDADSNGKWDGCMTDFCYAFGLPTDVPVTGDWNGGGKTRVGVRRGKDWYLDYNGNGKWDGCILDRCMTFGLPSDIAITGDWNGFGPDNIGVFRNGKWYLDYNGNGKWDGCSIDACISSFGLPGDSPVAGEWSEEGYARIGVLRNGKWYLDTGNYSWNGCSSDICNSFGVYGDIPVTGNWNMTESDEIGVFRTGKWYLDYNGNGIWDGCGTTQSKDRCYGFGLSTDKPLAGNW